MTSTNHWVMIAGEAVLAAWVTEERSGIWMNLNTDSFTDPAKCFICCLFTYVSLIIFYCVLIAWWSLGALNPQICHLLFREVISIGHYQTWARTISCHNLFSKDKAHKFRPFSPWIKITVVTSIYLTLQPHFPCTQALCWEFYFAIRQTNASSEGSMIVCNAYVLRV